MAGYLLLAFAVVAWLRGRKSAHGATRAAFNAMFLVLLAQIVLGIVTVLHAAPWQLGIAPQATAVLLWVLIIRARHLSQYPRFDTLRKGATA
jgi:cytochrome c oxidase assembly protein subunit 15